MAKSAVKTGSGTEGGSSVGPGWRASPTRVALRGRGRLRAGSAGQPGWPPVTPAPRETHFPIGGASGPVPFAAWGPPPKLVRTRASGLPPVPHPPAGRQHNPWGPVPLALFLPLRSKTASPAGLSCGACQPPGRSRGRSRSPSPPPAVGGARALPRPPGGGPFLCSVLKNVGVAAAEVPGFAVRGARRGILSASAPLGSLLQQLPGTPLCPIRAAGQEAGMLGCLPR